MVALTGTEPATFLTALIIHGKFAPSDPSFGFLTSMISAPPSLEVFASSTLIGLTSSFIYPLNQMTPHIHLCFELFLYWTYLMVVQSMLSEESGKSICQYRVRYAIPQTPWI